MCELHKWYLKASADGEVMFAARVKHSYLHRGLADVWIKFESLWFLYHQDALHKSLVSAFVMMKVLECRRRGYCNIGFMVPNVINVNNILKWPNQAENNIFMALDLQHTCTFILLPYNFNFHWILLSIQIDRSRVVVFDPKKKPVQEYQNLIDILQKACARFVKKHIGVTENPGVTDFPIWRMKEDLIEPERVRAIQEALCGFLLDELHSDHAACKLTRLGPHCRACSAPLSRSSTRDTPGPRCDHTLPPVPRRAAYRRIATAPTALQPSSSPPTPAPTCSRVRRERRRRLSYKFAIVRVDAEPLHPTCSS
ncbi:putative hydroxyproline-rich glycoprotein [Panicum miliaceum]|uniref:Hydroxyproline-rich glycoprotein n=1 Tax=Panicum miliaceum TaxID=4540 RepID=A0A3L6R4N9_PANMI|nr:putative hydroxyproline-rich glycoprotein [Panicum miliaceum]